MSIFAVIFIIFLLTLVAILIIYLILNFNKSTPNVLPQNCSEIISEVTDLTNGTCCYINGILTNYRLLSQYNLVVGPSPTAPEFVCPLFCTGTYNSDTQTCNVSADNAQISKCFTLTTPQNCNGIAMPVARVGSIPYYAVAPVSSQFCDVTKPCTT